MNWLESSLKVGLHSSLFLPLRPSLTFLYSSDPNSLYFAPSTIAVASIIVTLSGMNINCQPFIDRVPDFLLFPNDNLPFFRCSENKSDYLDCQRCTRALQQLPSVRERIKAISPVSITACDL